MSWVKQIFRFGFRLSLFFFVAFSVAFVFIWANPGVLINSKSVHWAMRFMPASFAFTTKALEIDAKSLSFFRKRLSLNAMDVCVELKEDGVKTCFDSISLSAEIDIYGWYPRYYLGPVTMVGGKLTIKPPMGPQPEPEKKAEESNLDSDTIWPKLPSFLGALAFDRVKIIFDRVHYESFDERADAKATVMGFGAPDRSDWKVQATGDYRKARDRYDGKLDLRLTSAKSPWFGPYSADISADANLPGGKRANVRGKLTPKGDRALVYDLKVAFQEARQRIHAEVSGVAKPENVDGKITGEALGFVSGLSAIQVNACRFFYGSADLTGDAKADAKIKKIGSVRGTLDCPVTLGTDFPRNQKVYQDFLSKISALVKADFDLPSKRSADLKGKFEVVLNPLLSQAGQGSGALKTEFSGKMQDFPSQLDFNTDLTLQVARFEKLVSALRGFPWAVPEPFSSLAGNISFKASAKGRLDAAGMTVPLTLQTRLASATQHLNIDGQGDLKLVKNETGIHADLNSTVKLSDIKLVLPYLSLQAPPRFFPDARIQVAKAPESEDSKPSPKRNPAKVKKAASSAFTFDYNIAIESVAYSPTRLKSNLVKSEVPLMIALNVSSKKPSTGSIRVGSFGIELFRRAAKVHHFYISLKPKSEDAEVDGQVQVVYTDYTVNIQIIGQLSKPEIKFQSVPPLPQKDVIAVLLFGKPLKSLDSTEASSVGSTSAAVQDSAVSLASMYLLAATPVESVGYDPAAKVFSAKVKLADGTSLNIGTDLKTLNQIGVRKRLARNWYLDTYVDNPLEAYGKRSTLNTFLEWALGY